MQEHVQKAASHWRWLVLVLLGTIAVAAAGYHHLEDYNWTQCIEWAVQSVTSTGYGDLPAKTDAGRLWASLTMLWGVLVLLSLVTSWVVNGMRKDPNLFTDAEQVEILSYIREKRAEEANERR